MRSLQLLTYKAEEGALVARARDYNTNWITATTVLDEDTFMAAENSYNLFTVAKNSDAAADEERNHLAVCCHCPLIHPPQSKLNPSAVEILRPQYLSTPVREKAWKKG